MKLNITEESIKRRTSKHVAVQAVQRGGEGKSGEEGENYTFLSHYKGIIYGVIAGSLEQGTVGSV